MTTTAPASASALGVPARGAARRRLRPRVLLVGTVVVLGAAIMASLAIGARAVPLGTVLDALWHAGPANGDSAVVLARVPRTLAGLLVGASLALAGAAMQGVARNPLADPGILGINAGAALAVVGGIFFLGATSVRAYLYFAFPGAAAAALVVYAVASLGRDGATPAKLAIAGAAVSAGCASLLNVMLVSSQDSLDLFRSWQVGALAGKSIEAVTTVGPFMALGAVLVLACGGPLNGLALGDDVARALGGRPGRTRAVSAVGVVLLSGSATALAGPVAFIGLVVPHVIRLLAGPDYRWLLPLSALLGPVVLLGADVLGRVVLPPTEIPAGILSALIGAPVFLGLVHRGRKVSL